jgi:glycosyltransferase involved in cell wall biosynthesis
MKILWLASWYPDAYEPVNGDFVQRHAKAVSSLMPIDVIHVVQVGKDVKTKKDCVYTIDGNLREWVYSFSFTKWGLDSIDKLRYHIKFRHFYRSLLLKYAHHYGKPDLIHVHEPLKAGIAALEMATLWGIPYIVTEHSSLYDQVATDNFYRRSFFFRYYTKKIFQNAACITCVSKVIASKIQQIMGNMKIEIIRNVVDTTLFNYQPQLSTGFKWLHVSSMQPVKNVAAILKAFQQLYLFRQDWELELIGPFNEMHVQWVREAGLSNHIFFKGEISHCRVAIKMKGASALVLFSKFENFPCVIIEALCCGLPVVSSDVGGIKEAVNRSNGILVESENIGKLTIALRNIMANYYQYNRILITTNAASTYAVPVIAKQFAQLYQHLL